MFLLERRWLLSKTDTRLSDVSKTVVERAHDHVERNRYKALTSLPLLLSLNTHLLG